MNNEHEKQKAVAIAKHFQGLDKKKVETDAVIYEVTSIAVELVSRPEPKWTAVLYAFEVDDTGNKKYEEGARFFLEKCRLEDFNVLDE